MRRPTHLLAVWGATLLAEVALFLFVRARPLFADIMRPVFVLLALPAVAATWRFARHRQGLDRRTHDRREHERREGRPRGGGRP